jgi:uncharacterized protein
MTKRDKAPVGAPCWIDLFTSDTDKARAFYGDLFGWTSEQGGEEYGGYITFAKDGIPVAGCMHNEGQANTPDVWSIYLSVTDAAATAEATLAHGGQVYAPAMQVMDLGSMAVLGDSGEAAIGAWQPNKHQGFGVFAEPGTPAWFELHTRDYESTVQFYRDVFGWDTHDVSDTPDFRYTTLGEGDEQLAGIMDASSFLPESVPAHWSVYFDVEDIDQALTRIADLGGSVVQGAEDTPYGRLARAADATGAVFRLVSNA